MELGLLLRSRKFWLTAGGVLIVGGIVFGAYQDTQNSPANNTYQTNSITSGNVCQVVVTDSTSGKLIALQTKLLDLTNQGKTPRVKGDFYNELLGYDIKKTTLNLAPPNWLNWFYYPSTNLGDVKELNGLNCLEVLSLDSATNKGWGEERIKSRLAGIDKLTSLTQLSLANFTKLTDIAFVSKLSKLQQLDLSNTGITDESLAAVSGLSNLHMLSLANTKISNVAPLASLTKMRWLVLSGAKIDDIKQFTAALSNMRELRRLDMSGGVAFHSCPEYVEFRQKILDATKEFDLQKRVEINGGPIGCW
ncbi:MAG: leucine-rich repeat domain-containing protein [Patescibacteria group bacterium]|jgi:Leucine-rich repeat (LRR) protein